jgi:prepilin peptidase CpaA
LLQLSLLGIVALSLGAAIFDWRTGTIPNWLTFGGILLGPIGHFAGTYIRTHSRQQALLEAGVSIAGLLICMIVPWLLYRQSAIGGGDVKALGAIGALGQISNGMEVQVFSFLCLAFVAPAILAYKGVLMTTLRNTFNIFANNLRPVNKQVPIEGASYSWLRLGPALLLASVFVAVEHWHDEPQHDSPILETPLQ